MESHPLIAFDWRRESVARVQVVADDGYVALTERVSAEVLDEEYFRGCLAERIAWAAADADAHKVDDGSPAPDEDPS